MADKQRSTSRRSPEENQNQDNERNPRQNNRNDMPRDVRFQPGGVDNADRNTSDLSGQSQPDNQPAADSSNVNVVNSEGPVQIGEGSTVHSPVYHNCNVHHHHHYHLPPHLVNLPEYLQRVEQQVAALGPFPSHSRLPPCPESHPLAGGEEGNTDRVGQSQTQIKPPVCSSQHGNRSSSSSQDCLECQDYHQRDHPPLAGISRLVSESRHSGQSHNQPVPQLLPLPQDTEQQASPKKGKQHQPKPQKQKPRQRSAGTPQPSTSDVRPNATRTERPDDSEAQSANTARSTHQTGAGRSEAVPDSVCIMDRSGRSLEPGDAVWFERDGYRRYGIYVGDQEVVWCEGRRDRFLVHKGELKFTDLFGKATVFNGGGVRLFPAGERVRRAESWVGRAFREGDVVCDGFDFPCWIFSGLGGDQVGDERDGDINLVDGCRSSLVHQQYTRSVVKLLIILID